MSTGRTAAIAAAVLLFSAPFAALRFFGATLPSGYLSIGFVALLAAIVALWPNDAALATVAATAPAAPPPSLAAALLVGVVGVVVLTYGLRQWVQTLVTQPFGADMLIVIREAGVRILQGLNPYMSYRTYDAPWGAVLPYGPLLWGPYLIPRIWHLDLRVITITGELFVPAAAAVTAALEAWRGRLGAALSWLVVVISLVASVQITGFTQIGHTPVYWPLLLLFAWLVARRRWTAAALTLGLLLVARSTMVALLPVFLIAVWLRARADAFRLTLLTALPVVVFYGPFLVWDAAALWSNVVASYPRLVKSVVWVAPEHGIATTLGSTGWLVVHGFERWVEPTQIAAMAVVIAAAWRACRRGAAPLQWMAAALAAFSLTALWPVFYIHFDVLLLLASGAVAETLGPQLSVRRWAIGLAALALAVTATIYSATHPDPEFELPVASTKRLFAVPRRATSAAFIEIDAGPGAGSPPLAIRATLNGQDLGTAVVSPVNGRVRFPAPANAWWTGFNQLELTPTVVDGAGFAVRRIAVVSSRR
ncbi:MAG: hypothetical protein ABI880_09170 [Acidobacteriota bacterium]